MGDAERLARDAVEKVTFDGLGGGISNRMQQPVKPFPVRRQIGKQFVDLGIVGDVAPENQGAVEFGGELVDTIQEAIILVGKGQLCTFPMAGPGDAVGLSLIHI